MGYRSDVAFTVYGDKEKLKQLKEEIDDQIENFPAEMADELTELFKSSVSETDRPIWNDDGEFFFFASHVKWYEGYPCVDFIEGMYKYAKDIGGLVGERVCVGEELDDNSFDYFDDEDNEIECEHRLSISRSIDYW